MNKVKKVTQQQYEQAMKDYNTSTRNAINIKQQRDSKIAAINERYDEDVKELTEKADAAGVIIKSYCEQNRLKMFGDKQSIMCWLGTIGFRKSPAAVVLPDTDGKQILEMLRKKGLVDFIATKEEVDKKSILKADNKQLKKLEGIGITIDGDRETFYIKLDEKN